MIRNPRNIVSYRYIPGALRDFSSLDNGAVMSREFLQRRSAEKFLAEKMADKRVQWAKLAVRT